MEDGDYVEIQCEGASPEDEGRIQWFFNNRVCIFFFFFYLSEILRLGLTIYYLSYFSFLMINTHSIHVVKLFIFVLFQHLIWEITVVQFLAVAMLMQAVL